MISDLMGDSFNHTHTNLSYDESDEHCTYDHSNNLDHPGSMRPS